MPPPTPDSNQLDAWLAGTLSADERKALEQSIAAPIDNEGDELLHDLDRDIPPRDERLTALIAELKTQPPDGSSALANDAWLAILTPSDDPGLLGTLGGYEVSEVIATGGMGIVFKARDPELDREVALKALDPDLALNATARERFLREARAAAKLEHENILPIHGVHEADGVPYFAMRLANGGTLQDALDRGESFDSKRLKTIGIEIAKALGAAHDQGIIHRDIKPGNILFDESREHVWVCDFGIARSTEDPSLTYGGAIAGTPQYMSPEQADGKELDGRSDLFALGAVLYRCAMGTQAFAGNTTAAVLKNVATVDPDLRGAKLPKWLANLLGNLLAKNPRDRPRDATAVLQALEHEHSATPLKGARRRKRWMTLAAAALLLALLIPLPATRTVVNRAIVAATGDRYLIDSRYGAYADLDEAVTAAEAGDTVLLPSGGTVTTRGTIVIPADKPLTIQAPDEQSLTLESVSARTTAILTESPLRLVGLDFGLDATSGASLIQVIRSELVLERCSVTNRASAANARPVAARAIELIGGGRVELIDCQIDLPRAIAVGLTGEGQDRPADVSIIRTQIRAGYGVHTRAPETQARQPVTLTMTDSRLAEGRLFKQNPTAPLPEVEFDVNGSTLANDGAIVSLQTHHSHAALSLVRWRGAGNTIDESIARMSINIGGTEDGPLLSGFDPDTGRHESTLTPPGRVMIEATGEQFESLADAIASAPSGSTLLLEGTLTCPAPVTTPPSHAITLRAATGAKPTVRGVNLQLPALELRGPTSLHGIRFERWFTSEDARAIVEIHAGGGGVDITDCKFLSPNNNSSPKARHRALSLSDASRATLHRCYLFAPGGQALALGQSAHDVQLTECLLVAGAAIENSAPSSSSTQRVELVIDRSVLVDNNAVVGAHPNIMPLRLTLTNSIADNRKHGFSYADVPVSKLPGLIEMRSHDCIFRGGSNFAHTYRQKAGDDFKAVTIANDAQRIAVFGRTGKTGDSNSVYWPNPFYLNDAPIHTLSPKELFESLNPKMESSAIATLEHFANPQADSLAKRDQPPPEPILITSFEEGQTSLIGKSADPEFGAAATLVQGDVGVSDGDHAALLKLLTDEDIFESRFQCALRFDIDSIKSRFTHDQQLAVDVTYKGAAGEFGGILLAYFDNTDGKLHQFAMRSFVESPTEPFTALFRFDEKGDGGRTLADLIANDAGQSVLNVFVNKAPETEGSLYFDNLRLLP